MDILVLNFNDAETTIEFVDSVKNYSCVGKILVVDNCSTDDSYASLKILSNDKISVVKTDKNGGYGYGNNYGIRYLHVNYNSKYILLSNPDVIVEESVLNQMEFFLRQNEEYAIVTPFMYNPQKEKCYNAVFKIPSKKDFILSTNWLYEYLFKPLFYKDVKKDVNPVKDVDAVAGSLFLMDVEDMLSCGMFDENIFLYWEEIVLGMKMKLIHKKMALLTNLSFIHNHSVSIDKTYKSAISKQKLFVKSKLYVLKKYYHVNFIEYFISLCLAKMSIVDRIIVPKIVHLWHIVKHK